MSGIIWLMILFGGAIGIYLLVQWRKNKAEEIRNEMKLQNLHKMGLLSQVWHRMYLKGESPIIHGFEYTPNVGVETVIKLWTSIAREYVTFRSVPYRIKKDWYWKELSMKDIDLTGFHIKSVEISAKKFSNNTNNECDVDQALCYFVNSLNMNAKWPYDKPHWNVYYITFKEKHLKHKV